MRNVSVITSCFNMAPYIEKTVQSVLDQTIPALEHIVVNDGSTDDSLELLMELEKNDPYLRVLNVTNRGQPNARNAGLISMDPRAEGVIFLDGDDWLEPNFIEETTSYMADGAVCVFPKIRFWVQGDDVDAYMDRWYGAGRHHAGEPVFHTKPVTPTLEELWRGPTMHPTALFSADFIKEVGGFNGRVLGPCDWDMYIDLVARGHEIIYCPTTYYNCIVREDSQSHSRPSSDIFRPELWRHHWRSLSAAGLNPRTPSGKRHLEEL